MPKLGRKIPIAKRVVNHLYSFPVVSAADIEVDLKISKQTANSIINELVKIGILKEITGQKRSRIYQFDEYIKLFGK